MVSHLIRAAASLFSLFILYLASDLYFMNQGDFDRIAWYYFERPTDINDRVWQYKEEFERFKFDLAVLFFGTFAGIQSLWSEYYSFGLTATAARIAMIAYAWILAKLFANLIHTTRVFELLLFLAFLVCFFYSHNTAMLNSLYGEFIFMLSLPMLMIGVHLFEGNSAKKSGLAVILVCATLLGTSKSQYFYAPMLLGIAIFITDLQRRRPTKYFLYAALAISQVICALPIANNKFAQLNYYHSMYFGSYMSLTATQIDGLNLTPAERSCIGVDAWGNKASGYGGLIIEGGQPTCYGNKEATALDVLRPYWLYPDLIVRTFRNALPHFATVEYFHVYPSNIYVKPSSRSSNPLITLTRLRDVLITSATLPILLASLFFAFAVKSTPAPLNVFLLFLSLFYPSQALISLFGEGLRDLGKHMWAAQYALDILIVILTASAFSLYFKTKKQNAHED